MRNYFSLPQFQPGDSRINVAPVQDALEGWGNKTMQFNQIERQNEEQKYQRGRETKQDARQETFDNMRIAEALAKRADGISRLPPEQIGPAWKRHLAEHERYFPGNQLDPEDLDPMTGPQRYAAAFGGIARDPRADRMADIQLKTAEANLANAQRPRTQPAPEVRELVDNEGNKYTGQWNGQEWVRIGGAERKPSVAESSVDRQFAKTYEEDFASGGVKDQEKNLAQLREVRDTLKNPQGPNVTGPLVGRLPDFINSFINPTAVDTRERVEEVVQRNLRVILGAQFTNEEGKRLIARAYNPALPEAVNAQRLTNLITAMDGALQAKKAAAQYYEQNGTLRGYKGPTSFSVSDIESAIDGGGQRKGMDLGDGFTVEVGD